MLNQIILLAALSRTAFAETGKTLHLCENAVAKIYVSPRGTALEFPIDPQDVVLGAKASFTIKYIRNDLDISPATMTSRSNLFVYLQGRRFVLDLTTSQAMGGTLYFIKDCALDREKVKNNGR